MAQLLALLAACLAASVVLARRPMHAVALVLGLWIAIPAIGSPIFTGQPSTSGIGFHPAAWLTLTVVAVQLLWNPRPFARAVGRHGLLTLALGVFVIGAAMTSVLAGSGGTKLLVNMIVTPVLLLFLILAHGVGDERSVRLLRNTVLVGAACQAVLALVQTALGDVLFFQQQFAAQYWFRGERQDRWMGTTDGHLTLALLVSVAAMMSLGLRKAGLRFFLLMLYTAGVLATQSRTGVLFLVLAVTIAVLLVKMPLWSRLLSLGAVAVASVGILALGLADGFFGRLEYDTGSSNARASALNFFLLSTREYLIGGAGLTASYAIGRAGGLQTSIESSILMYAIDVGLVLAVIYFGTMVVIVLRHAALAPPWATLAAGTAFVLVNSSSALAFSNLAGALLWVTIAIVMASSYVVLPKRSATDLDLVAVRQAP